jgi:thioesterase domain-containing protein
MNCQELLTYLHTNIPITRSMEVSVVSILPDSVTLSAPLAPNKNHRETAFGGSVSTLATLSAWSFLRIKLGDLAKGTHLVIQRNSMEYLKPITGFFTASASLPEGTDWARFERTLKARGRARINIGAVVNYKDDVCARFEGEFVALLQK